ncbi:MAG: hypothetical protein A4C66_01860 [Nitrospira sp. HN-bin3]|nr:MAG: hypothetical protein A4C66_01860 [Nitrospira sp. HN-bin3]
MRQHILTALAIFAVTGIVSQSPNLAQAWQGNNIAHLSGILTNAAVSCVEQQSLIHKVGADSYSGGYSGMSGADIKSGAASSPQAGVQGTQPRSTGDYKFSSPGTDGRYGSMPSNPSDNFLKKESSGSSAGPYGSSVYGGLPSTPSADPMIKDLSR